jgi:hypothetical protein
MAQSLSSDQNLLVKFLIKSGNHFHPINSNDFCRWHNHCHRQVESIDSCRWRIQWCNHFRRMNSRSSCKYIITRSSQSIPIGVSRRLESLFLTTYALRKRSWPKLSHLPTWLFECSSTVAHWLYTFNSECLRFECSQTPARENHK